MACRRSALLGLLSALGALGRRFESCRPDSNYPSHRQVTQPVLFYYLNSVLNDCGQIADKRCLIERESILSRRYKKHFKNNSSQSNRQNPNSNKPMIKKS